MRPLKDWMILEEIKQKAGSLIVPDSVKRDQKGGFPSLFKIEQMGPGWWERGMFFKSEDYVKIGQTIVLEGIDCARFTVQGKEYKAGRVREVALIVKGG